MIKIWDWHGDEFSRVNHFVEGERYRGSETPEFDVMAVADGQWLYRIPKEQRHKCIVYPCVKHTDHITMLGYKYAFVKDKHQQSVWKGESVILPPIVDHIRQDKDIKRNLSTICHHFKHRDKDGWQFSKDAGSVIFGYDETISQDWVILSQTRFLLHPKKVGYLCNAVIKAISTRTPVIFTKESFEYGYKDYLTPNVDCLIAESPQHAIDLSNMSVLEYMRYRDALRETINKIRDMYPEAKDKANKLVQTVYNLDGFGNQDKDNPER